MDLEHVRKELRRIEAMSGDDEAAHAAEDLLHWNVLRYYAQGGTDQALAQEAMKSADIKFARWCA